MAIRIKRSSGDTAPASLASGQLAYVEGATNGGQLYIGEIGGTVRAIAGKKYIDKLNGIAAGAIANVVEDTTPQLGGSLDVNGQSIVSVSNGNITLAPNGTGKVVISGDLQIDGTTTTINSTTLDVDDLNITVAKGAANAAAANGAGLTVEGPTTSATILYASSDDSWNFNKKTAVPELQVDNINVNGNTISSTDTDGSITLTPNGIGDVQLLADTILVGDSGSTATITTNGAGNLTLTTNSGTSSGSIQINQGAAGNIVITPDTTGDIRLDSDTVRVGDSAVTANITSNGVADLVLSTNGGTNTGAITISGVDSPITIEPNGTGDVNLNADTVRIGDSNAAATITTNGTGNLVLNTNAGTNSGSITIAQGVNGNISIAANGTGVISATSPIIAVVSSTANTPPIFARHTVTASASDTYPSINIQKHRSDIAFTSMTDEPSVVNFQVRDSTSANRTFFRMIGRYAGTSTNPSFTLRGSPNGFTTDLHYMSIGGGVGTFGSASSDYTLTANTGGALKLTANSNTDSGVITIASGVDGAISLQPNGTGKLLLDNTYWPAADGTANQILKTDGAGQAAWVSANSLVTDTNTTYAVSAETVTGGANLRLTGSDASTDDVKIAGGTNVTVTRTDANTITISSADTGITDLVQDTTPQLGGSLDVNGQSIVSVSNGNITLAPNGTGLLQLQADIFVGRTNTDVQISSNGTADLIFVTNNNTSSGIIRMYDGANGNIDITPNGTGSIVLDGLSWPQADGSANYVLKTNGSGQLSWVAQTAGVTTFIALTDAPASYSGAGGYYVKVNAGATALEFSQDVDDGTF
jgi:hypothetical protein